MLIEVCKLETLCSRVQASAYLFSHASVSTSQFGRQLSLSAGQSRDGDRLNTASYTEDIKRITFALVSRPRSTRFTTKEVRNKQSFFLIKLIWCEHRKRVFVVIQNGFTFFGKIFT